MPTFTFICEVCEKTIGIELDFSQFKREDPPIDTERYLDSEFSRRNWHYDAETTEILCPECKIEPGPSRDA